MTIHGQFKRKADPFEVWGRGTQVRDFVHIDDVVGATFAAVINDVGVMNICTGRPTSFIELAEMVMLQAGYLAPIKNNLFLTISGVNLEQILLSRKFKEIR